MRQPMPLWNGPERPLPSIAPEARPASLPTAFGPAPTPEDLYWAEFDQALKAWDELGLPVPASEIRAAVAQDLAVLSPPPAATPPLAAPTPTPRAPTAAPAPVADPAPAVPAAANAVEAAEAGADAHAESLKDHPEWQRIQTVRGALRHVWDVMKENAGPYWENLKADIRFQGFWKTASIRACEAISASASALARRFQGDLPTADALLKFSHATLTYSTVATTAEPAPAPAPAPAATPAEKPGVSAEAPMQRLVERTTPTAYATREDSVRAAEEVTTRFRKWLGSPMGQELVASDHRRVTEFREAWQQLPPHDSGPGPAVGPYGNVAERAKALVTAAVGSARFAPGDLQALQALAQTADHHAARLAVTLPPGTAAPSPKAAASTPRAAAPPPAATRTPRAAM